MIILPPDHPYHFLEKSRYAIKLELEDVLKMKEPYSFYGVDKHDLIEYLKYLDEFAKVKEHESK